MKKDLLKLLDLTSEDILEILDTADQLKAMKKAGIQHPFLAGLIAFSRLYLFVHFPTDVLAGAAIGTALGYLVTAMAGKSGKYKGKGGDAI